ncbi:DUF547 domain-containing protein [Haloarculaceae archaeon H-GB1-1]|nr:DUF547 domain-containing protein [Haloarculaceae archaeon H-GB1-1]
MAGQDLILDDIEHGILRRGYVKWGLGYLRNPFGGGFAREQELDERDLRVHFALNCGAESSPLIAVYTREGADEELDWVTEGYLEAMISYDAAANRATVPRVMLWFRGDFGGKSGIVEMLRRYGWLPESAWPRLSYREWDWSLARGRFVDGEQRSASDPGPRE